MTPEIHVREAVSGDIDGLLPLLKELFCIETDSFACRRYQHDGA